MSILLEFIQENLSFLYGDLGFRFNDSKVKEEYRSSLLYMEKGKITIEFTRHKGEIEIYFKNNAYEDLFSLYEIIAIITGGKKTRHDIPDPQSILFLKNNFDRVEHLLIHDFDRAAKEKNKMRAATLRSLGFRGKDRF
jgi:hypothetical protein